MDVDFTPEDMSFREEVRSFIEENYPKHLGSLDRGDMSKEDLLAWHKVLHTKGWVAPSWPAEFGGTDWTVTQRYIFNEESARHGTIPPMPFGVQMLGPVIYTFGNQEQKDWVLPGILSGEDWWCQGYSEPGAGSDLAALKTKAVLEGDEYVVNGHKTTSAARAFGAGHSAREWVGRTCEQRGWFGSVNQRLQRVGTRLEIVRSTRARYR